MRVLKLNVEQGDCKKNLEAEIVGMKLETARPSTGDEQCTRWRGERR